MVILAFSFKLSFSMQIDIAPALANWFHPEPGPGHSLRAQASRMEQTEIRELTCAVERAVNGAIADVGSTLRLGENVGLAVVSQNELPNHAPHPEEARILDHRACERRRVEFALGRAAGHLALKQLDSENTEPILQGLGGEPLWRDGVAGSITHCFPWSAAIVVKSSNHFAIGVDLETMEGIQGTDISHLVCREAELGWVRRGDFQERLTMIFSAKEAVYKALYPVCLRYIDFKEVGLTWLPEHSCFHAEFVEHVRTSLPCGEVCAVHCRRHAEMVFSCVIHRFHWKRHSSKSGNFIHSPVESDHRILRHVTRRGMA